MPFSDSRPSDRDRAEFASCWQRAKITVDGGSQTHEILTEEIGIQAVDKVAVEVQTDKVIVKPHVLSYASAVTGLSQEATEDLCTFLRRVEPMFMQALAEGEQTNAFDGYDVRWEDEEHSVTCKHTLSHAEVAATLQVTAVDWFASASTIAVAYGRLDHEGWGTEKSFLCTWNLDMSRLNAFKADRVIEVESTIMSLACHPSRSAVVAVGTFNGEVIVLDLSRPQGTEVLYTSGVQDSRHTEAIASVCWNTVLNQHQDGSYRVVSSAADGRVIVWAEPSKGGSQLELVGEGQLQTNDVPQYFRQSKAPGSSPLGVTCLSMLPQVPGGLVVGTEGGCVLRCTVPEEGSMGTSRSTASFAHQGHIGPVYGVAASPHNARLYASASTDKSLRVFHSLQARPLFTLEPEQGYIYGLDWSPSRPAVVAATTSNGAVVLYDLLCSRVAPAEVLSASERGGAVHAIAFNRKRSRLVATGDVAGVVRVWSLSDALMRPVDREAAQLAEIVIEAME